MKFKVRIPTPLQAITQNKAEVEGTGKTIGEVLASLITQYSALETRFYDDQKKLRRFINV